jgi:hypothetical protein
MQLFAVSVGTAAHSKSQGDISVRGKGYDTPSITIAAIVLKRCLTM